MDKPKDQPPSICLGELVSIVVDLMNFPDLEDRLDEQEAHHTTH